MAFFYNLLINVFIWPLNNFSPKPCFLLETSATAEISSDLHTCCAWKRNGDIIIVEGLFSNNGKIRFNFYHLIMIMPVK